MKTRLKIGAACAAFALASGAAQALDVLHIANANSPDYEAFIAARPENSDEDPSNDFTWTHIGNGTGAGQVGGPLSRTTTFTGLHGGEKTVKQYLESFDLIIIGNGINSANFTDNSGWSGLTKPLLVHSALVARSNGTGTNDRLCLFTGGQTSFTYGNPTDTLPATPASPLRTAIFGGVTDSTNLYSSSEFTSTEACLSTATFGGGVLISSLVTTAAPGTPGAHGVVFWQAGSANALGQVQAAKRGYMVLRNGNDSSTTLTADGKQVLGNLIDQLLISAPVVFLPPTNLVAQSAAGSTINLSWVANEGAVSYNVKRSLTAVGPYTTISSPGVVTGTTYQDTGLTNGTTYYYVVSGVNAGSTESANSAQASAVAVDTLLPGINILYVASGNSTAYQNFATNGKFANNTWTHRGLGTTADNTIGGDLYRSASFTGSDATTVIDYMQSFDLIIVGVPVGSANFIDGADGASWADVNKPLLFHSAFAARELNAGDLSQGGRVGLFSGDNVITFTFDAGTPVDTLRVSNSARSNILLNGVGDVTNLYSFASTDTISGQVPIPNAFGNGELITSVTNGTINHRGVVFWQKGATLAVGTGLVIESNRAFVPLKGDVNDLSDDGKIMLANLIQELREVQTAPLTPLLTIPTEVVALEGATGVELGWNPSIGATGYKVKRSTTMGGGYVEIATIMGNEAYIDESVAPGQTYYYVVTAISNTAETVNSAEVTVTLAGGSGYDSWIAGFAAQLPDPADRLPGADPDKDGSSNLIEFALNGNPASGSDNGAITSLIQNSSLTLIFAARNGANFGAGASATVDGIIYTVEGSLDLAFPNSPVSSLSVSKTAPAAANLPDLTATNWEYHTFKLNASDGLLGKGFLRLKVAPALP